MKNLLLKITLVHGLLDASNDPFNTAMHVVPTDWTYFKINAILPVQLKLKVSEVSLTVIEGRKNS